MQIGFSKMQIGFHIMEFPVITISNFSQNLPFYGISNYYQILPIYGNYQLLPFSKSQAFFSKNKINFFKS